MLELSHNSVVIIDAVVRWYGKRRFKDKPPFEKWWKDLSDDEKLSVTFKVMEQHLQGSLPEQKG